jgi:acetyl-CoA C-acetyltransferase
VPLDLDGVAAVVVMSAEAAERARARALAEIGTHGNVAGPDNSLHSQPSNAIRQALAKAGRTVSDLAISLRVEMDVEVD